MNIVPKFVKDIEMKMLEKLNQIQKPDSKLLESQQIHRDQILQVRF